ncbi:threonylcarbamoyl-AMP synthase [Atopobacter sp. AH10]|nr:threonylcarbamoyl-AMP synthase [Atopobacter sp. AH10]
MQIFGTDDASLNKAAKLLKSGELVAFPTETVYGLGALATDERAVLKVFEAKGRPSDNPLIVTVSSVEMVEKFVGPINSSGKALMDAFWPGSLTLILPIATSCLPNVVSAGLKTVAVRMPDNAVTRKLIELVGQPIVGPSANISGRPSPTKAEHVESDFRYRIAGVIDDGTTPVGIESTIVDVSDEDNITVLRPGDIREEQIAQVVGPLSHGPVDTEKPKAPGMKYRHYAPLVPVVAKNGGVEDFLPYLEVDYPLAIAVPSTIYRALEDDIADHMNMDRELVLYDLGEDVKDFQHRLYGILRDVDETPAKELILYVPLESDETAGYLNRALKASSSFEDGL